MGQRGNGFERRRAAKHPAEADRNCVRVIGCGRRFRGDDQAGLLVAQAVEAMELPGTQVATTEAPCADLFDTFCAEDLLVVVDAAQARNGLRPGTVTRIDYRKSPERLAARCRTNTHTLSIDAALELGRELGLLPSDVWVYAVGAEDFDFGDEVSESVANGVLEAARRIRRDIEAWLRRKELARA
ncbi:MAG: hydrogenase maturation protease [Phycisphaerales bacterium]|nr:MAG: hydrogenase maturation protease [Phycisphaerales bacterium]